MTQDSRRPAGESVDEMDALEAKLEESDAAAAPETAEEIARRLGETLDRIEGGRGSGTL